MTRIRRTRIRIREVTEHLGTDPATLSRLRDEGLFEADDIDSDEADDLRIATLLVEELGVNAAGVQVALHLRRRLVALESRITALAERPERPSHSNQKEQGS